AIAVPVPPPPRRQTSSRWRHILADATVQGVLTTTKLLEGVEQELTAADTVVPYVVTDAITSSLVTDSDRLRPRLSLPEPNLQTIAFLQYTSGSTSQPKGVTITHDNLCSNLTLIQKGFKHSSQSCGVIWLPAHHDMGLIGGVLQPLQTGFPVTLMSPAAFLRQPLRWLQLITQTQATTSGGPNFAYEHCLKKIKPEQCQGLDLSRWDVAFVGAEPVRSHTLQRFAKTFAPFGFRAEAFYPCYGLAESTLFVTGGQKQAQPRIERFDRKALAQGQAIGIIGVGNRQAARLVSCGTPAADHSLHIVKPDACVPLPEGQVGEIWLASPSVTQGYWRQLAETQATFSAYLADGRGPFLRTGDLGFIDQDELFVTGRLKDLLTIRGQNHYPHDLELTVAQSHPDLQGNGAAFSVEVAALEQPDGAGDEQHLEEQLVVVQEVARRAVRSLDVESVTAAIRGAIARQHGLQAHAIVLVKPGQVPVTSSGKVQRYACKQRFEAGTLTVVNPSKSSLSKSIDSKSVEIGAIYDRAFGTLSTANLQAASRHHSVNNSELKPAPETASESSHTTDPVQAEQRTADLIQWLRQYANTSINSRVMDERRCLSPGVVLDFGNQGLLGMQVPEALGGLGLGHRHFLRVIEQLGAIDPTLSLFVGLNNVLGIRPILHAGSPELQAELLPRLATGRELAAFALTEPGAGSHPLGIQSQAQPVANGQWHLHGHKVWSGSAAWAGITNVFVQDCNAQGQPQGISGFVVRKGTPGLRQGPEALTMGMRGMVQNAIYLDGVPVTRADRLGEAGQGMAVAQDAMMYGRLAIAAASVGGMKRCAQLMLRYGSRRTIATGQLLNNPAVLLQLTDVNAKITALETLVDLMATHLDQGHALPTEIYAACKILGPEFYWQTADALMQCLGGRGYIETNLAPQILRDARILRIFEGPTETLAMYLGGRVLDQPATLRHFLGEQLEQGAIATQLFEQAEQILARYLSEQSPFSDPIVARRQACLVIGAIAAFAILLAVQQQAGALTLQQQQALQWTQLHLEQHLAQAFALQPAEAALTDATILTDWIQNYETSIGDLEQTLAGEDDSLDPFLQQGSSLQPDLDSQQLRPATGPELWSPLKSPLTTALPRFENTLHSTQLYNTQPHITQSTQHPAANQQPQTTKSLQQWLTTWLSDHLKVPVSSIQPTQAFADYGLDSVLAVELAQDIETVWQLQTPLDVTVAWNFPTIEALSQYLATLIDTPLVNQPLGSAVPEFPQKSPLSHGKKVGTAKLDELSEAEMAAELAAELLSLQGRE
ncbi:MAG: AMP-binding protein, partial [Cyanobacteria bacterium P01_H01_bin.121]